MTELPPLAGLPAFAATKPADEKYDYDQPRMCAFNQYLRSLGHEFAVTYGASYYLDDRSGVEVDRGMMLDELHRDLDLALIPQLADDKYDRTWGALAARLEALA